MEKSSRAHEDKHTVSARYRLNRNPQQNKIYHTHALVLRDRGSFLFTKIVEYCKKICYYKRAAEPPAERR